jgi:hypothetical protein
MAALPVPVLSVGAAQRAGSIPQGLQRMRCLRRKTICKTNSFIVLVSGSIFCCSKAGQLAQGEFSLDSHSDLEPGSNAAAY